jgi:putative transposase
MRGIPPALPITVTKCIHILLKKEYAKTSIPVSYKKRLGIILDGIAGKSMYSTSKERKIKWDTVQKWRNRWKSKSGQLNAIEQDSTADKLKVIKRILSDLPRATKPPKFTLAQEQQIIAIACEKPEDHGLEVTNWTWQLIADVAAFKKIVESISRRHVGHILKKTN